MNAPATKLNHPAHRSASRFAVTLGGEAVELDAQRALHWPREATLFVADLHLGKAAAFRAGGVAVPRGTTATDLGRLSALLAETGARRLVVLGDFLHAAAGRVDALDEAFRRWRDVHRSVDVVVVRGNHDAGAGDPPSAWGLRVVDAPFACAPFIARHEPVKPRTGFALCGHVHPGVLVAGANDAARLPCFVIARNWAILPAFGRLTGLASVRPERGTAIVAIAGRQLFRLPTV